MSSSQRSLSRSTRHRTRRRKFAKELEEIELKDEEEGEDTLVQDGDEDKEDKEEDEDNEAADDEVDVGAKKEVARVLQRSILSFMPSGSKSGDAKRRKETTQAELVKTRTSPRKKAKTQRYMFP